MHRRQLLGLLDRHEPRDKHENASLGRIAAFVQSHAGCFERSLTIGHITGSAWVVSRDGTRVLLTHHRKLGMWLQLGGHADGDPDVLAVAMREAREESGIHDLIPLSPDIFDVDVHRIPQRGDEPAHDHYDIRFLLAATDSERTQISDESNDLRWFTANDVMELDVDDSIKRMHAKWLAFHTAEAVSSR